MNSQHYMIMKILSRTTNNLEDALESLDVDGPNLSITESGKELPHYSKLYITPANIEGYFEIKKWSKYQIKILATPLVLFLIFYFYFYFVFIFIFCFGFMWPGGPFLLYLLLFILLLYFLTLIANINETDTAMITVYPYYC